MLNITVAAYVLGNIDGVVNFVMSHLRRIIIGIFKNGVVYMIITCSNSVRMNNRDKCQKNHVIFLCENTIVQRF